MSMVPTWMLCNLYTYAPYLRKLCGNLFMTFYTRTFSRSVNCQGISSEADTTQMLDIWRTRRTHQGYVCHSKGIEMLQWNINLICPCMSQSVPCQLPLTCAVWVESVLMRCTSSRSVSVVCLDYKVCTFHHLSNVCM